MDLPFLLKKTAAHLLYPSGLIFLFLFLALLVSFSRIRRSQTRLFLFLAALIFYSSTTFLPGFLLRSLECRYSLPEEEVLAGAEAIVLLPAYISSKPALRLMDRFGGETSKRFLAALLLKKRFPEKPLVIIGAGAGGGPGATYLKELAERLGFEGVVALDEANDTASSARVARRYLGPKPLILVTAAYHLPRAVFLFKREGLLPVPYPAYKISREKGEFSLRDLWPHPINLFYSDLAVHEYLGLAFYRIIEHIPLHKKEGG